MKNRIVLLIALLVTGLGYAQIHSSLYDNTWYLNSIEIDGVSYSAPANAEVPFITLDISETNPNFLTSICNDGFGDIEAVDPLDSFRFPNGLDVTLLECEDPDNVIFENLYFNEFYLNNIDETFYYHFYIIDSEGPSYGLSIYWGPNQNQSNWAHYFDTVVLSVPTTQLPYVSVFPNPVTETLNIKFLNEIAFPVQVSLIDTAGKLLLSNNLGEAVDNFQMDMKNVPSGLYFVQVVDDKGKRLVKKIIK